MEFFLFGKTEKMAAREPLRLFNTMSGSVEEFQPLSSKHVTMYNCGPTVYDRQHIGNMFSAVFTNTLRRTLDHWGYQTKQVTNITDVGHLTGDNTGDADTGEDRMEASAKKLGRSAQDIANEITALYFADLDALGMDRSKVEYPRATAYISQQIALVQTLYEKGYAYVISDGVYFDTAKFTGYGKLGGIDLQGQMEGARVEENPEKKNRHDFALWKFSPKNDKRQQEWKSPWGVGFPGWHVECTAMIFTLLGKTIDIHTGGIEHVSIHHNNEIAQAEAASGKQYVRYWMHNNHITIEGKKISKSQGNTVYLQQIIDRGFSARAFRLWALGGHYRTPMNFTWDAIEGADAALKRLTRYYFEETRDTGDAPDKEWVRNFESALADDLNTAKALACVWDLIKNDSITTGAKHASLRVADTVLGLGFTQTRPLNKIAVTAEDIPEEVRELLEARKRAREDRDFTTSDQLRTEIEKLGYKVVDSSTGQNVEKAAD